MLCVLVSITNPWAEFLILWLKNATSTHNKHTETHTRGGVRCVVCGVWCVVCGVWCVWCVVGCVGSLGCGE